MDSIKEAIERRRIWKRQDRKPKKERFYDNKKERMKCNKYKEKKKTQRHTHTILNIKPQKMYVHFK